MSFNAWVRRHATLNYWEYSTDSGSTWNPLPEDFPLATEFSKQFDMAGMAAPAASASGKGRIYFDSTANLFKVSQHAGSYENLVKNAPPTEGCRVYNNADATITNNTLTAITFNSERFDTDSMHSTSSNTSRITFNTAGKYLVGGCIVLANALVPGAGVNGYCSIRLNGTTYISYQTLPESNSSWCTLTINCIYNFAQNDYIELMVQENSGSNFTLKYYANNSPEFWAHRLS